MTARFCPRCRRDIANGGEGSGTHKCQRAARHDEPTQPVRTGEIAGSADPGFFSGPESSEEPL